jgi:hypothetical protein
MLQCSSTPAPVISISEMLLFSFQSIYSDRTKILEKSYRHNHEC